MIEHIRLERPESHPGILVIRFDRPEKKNAITRDMYDAMAKALSDARADEQVAAAVFLGQPGCFTAGNDLADFLEVARDPTEAGHVAGFIRELARFDKPLLSGIDGLAIGIGVTMQFHCDLTFATPRSTFRTPFTDLAVVPEGGSSLLAPRVMGMQRAFALLVAGAPFTAEEARDAGLIWKVVPEEELQEAALAAASDLASKPRKALLQSRRLLRGEPDEILDRINHETHLFVTQLRSPEAVEIYERFLASRAAKDGGRKPE